MPTITDLKGSPADPTKSDKQITLALENKFVLGVLKFGKSELFQKTRKQILNTAATD